MERLDIFLVKRELFSSREKAQEGIKHGRVEVNGKIINKPSFMVTNVDKIEVKKVDEYVSRGAYKLKTAYENFDLNFKDRVVLDIGASTGGFTQYALSKGAKRVYSVDVGRGELSPVLLSDERVVNIEGQDFRTLDSDRCIDVNMIVGDVSFISLKHIFPKIVNDYGNKIEIVMLFKPQFECGKDMAKKYKGVVLDKALHIKLLEDFLAYVKTFGFVVSGLCHSAIKGKEGNIEYLFHLNGIVNSEVNIPKVVEKAFANKNTY